MLTYRLQGDPKNLLNNYSLNENIFNKQIIFNNNSKNIDYMKILPKNYLNLDCIKICSGNYKNLDCMTILSENYLNRYAFKFSFVFKSRKEIDTDSLLRAESERLYEYCNLMRKALKEYNASLFYQMRRAHPKLFALFILELANQREKDLVATHLLINDEATSEIITNYMQNLAKGFGYLKYQEGLLICAQVSAKKSYLFNPTILRDSDVTEYLTLLANVRTPVRERFILTGSHWVSGDICIDNGKVSLFFIDPMGNGHVYNDLVSEFRRLFPNQEIYVSADQRQHGIGCSVYALDDAIHLYTVEGYIGVHLHEFARRQKSTPDQLVSMCHLPLSMERTMRSTQLFSTVIPERDPHERSLPVNKKGENAQTSAKKDFRYDIATGKIQNKRLERKLQNMTDDAFIFLCRTDLSTLPQRMRAHTIDGFRERMQQLAEYENKVRQFR